MESVTEKRYLEVSKAKEPYKTIIETLVKVLPKAHQFDYYLVEVVYEINIRS